MFETLKWKKSFSLLTVAVMLTACSNTPEEENINGDTNNPPAEEPVNGENPSDGGMNEEPSTEDPADGGMGEEPSTETPADEGTESDW